ncbi:MAG: hypothetical protein AAGC72_15655 [Planctomycetota bacterium]
MPTKAELIKTLCQTRLGCFARVAFGWAHPERKYKHHWPMDVLGDALERCSTGETKRLIINMPPRSLKSFKASVAFPAWVLARKPETKIMCIAGSRGLADDLHTLTLKLMKHPGYRALFPHIKLTESGSTIRLAHGGSRGAYVASPGGGITGRGADIVVVDDPLGASHADDDQRREAINLWYDQNVYQRLDDKHKGVVVVVMQRLHVDDLTGHLLNRDGWEVLNLPAIAIEDELFTLSDGRLVGRSKGEALHPGLEDHAQVRQLMLDAGAKIFMAQYQQEPYAPGQGNGYHGAATFLSHPDEVPRPGWSPWGFTHIEEERLVLDKVFGERMCVMPGFVPFQTVEDWLEWAQEYTDQLRANGHFDDWPHMKNKRA